MGSRKSRLAAEAKAVRLTGYNSEIARFERLRAEQDRRLSATDYLMTSDYPLTDEQSLGGGAKKEK